MDAGNAVTKYLPKPRIFAVVAVDGRRTVVSGARLVSGAFDQGRPVWPPQSNSKYDHLGGFWGGQSQIPEDLGGCAPSQNLQIFPKISK